MSDNTYFGTEGQVPCPSAIGDEEWLYEKVVYFWTGAMLRWDKEPVPASRKKKEYLPLT